MRRTGTRRNERQQKAYGLSRHYAQAFAPGRISTNLHMSARRRYQGCPGDQITLIRFPDLEVAYFVEPAR
jgi:hypothetical protein